MSSNDWVSVGRVGRPHGLDGSFFVEDASEAPDRLAVGAHVHVRGERATVVAAKRGGGGRLVIRLDVTAPRGASLDVPAVELPEPEEDSFYVFRLVGLRVEEEDGRLLGRVQEVAAGVANDVLELDTRLALPFVEECVRAVELEEGRIVVASGFAEPD